MTVMNTSDLHALIKLHCLILINTSFNVYRLLLKRACGSTLIFRRHFGIQSTTVSGDDGFDNQLGDDDGFPQLLERYDHGSPLLREGCGRL